MRGGPNIFWHTEFMFLPKIPICLLLVVILLVIRLGLAYWLIMGNSKLTRIIFSVASPHLDGAVSPMTGMNTSASLICIVLCFELDVVLDLVK